MKAISSADWSSRVAAQVIPEERDAQLDRRKRAAGVAALGGVDHPHDIGADAFRDGLEFGDGVGGRGGCGHRKSLQKGWAMSDEGGESGMSNVQ